MILKIIITILIGAACFFGWHFFVNMSWEHAGSLDIISGAILEFFLITMIFHFFNLKHEQQLKRHFAAHLDQIESVLNRATIQIDKLNAQLKKAMLKGGETDD